VKGIPVSDKKKVFIQVQGTNNELVEKIETIRKFVDYFLSGYPKPGYRIHSNPLKYCHLAIAVKPEILWEQEVPSSNLGAPTIHNPHG